MRTFTCVTVWLMLASCLSAQTAKSPTPAQNLQTGYCPNIRELQAEPSQQFFFDGTIGTRRVRMFLDRGGSEVVGLFYYRDGDWKPTVLGGDWKNGVIEMTDATDARTATGRLVGQVEGDKLAGSWTSLPGGAVEPVTLSKIAKSDCDGNGPWKRFDDPKWPISFSYPAEWLVHASDESIALICPNPEKIASGGEVEIHEGEGSPDGPTQLVRCGQGWKYGAECGCERADSLECQTAKVSHQGRKTILDVSDREWRIYCRDGGYVAAGDGVDRIVLLGDAWLEVSAQLNSSAIIDRLIETIRPQSSHKSK